jgi:hypothetical protein
MDLPITRARDLALKTGIMDCRPVTPHIHQKMSLGRVGIFPDLSKSILKFLSKLSQGSLGRFKFSPELSGVDWGFAKRACHNVFLEPTDRFIDLLLALRAGNGEGLVAE